MTVNGLTENEITEPIAIAIDVTSVTPSTDINFLGGDILTIAGDNFGFNSSAVEIVFEDDTQC